MADFNALYVGSEKMRKRIEKENPSWSLVKGITSIDELWKVLNLKEVTDNIDAIFVEASLFDLTGSDTTFEKLVFTLAPFTFLGIVSGSEKTNALIQSRVRDAANKIGFGGKFDYYFLNKDDLLNGSSNAVSQLVSVVKTAP